MPGIRTPEERLKHWQRVEGVWKDRTPDQVAELEKGCRGIRSGLQTAAPETANKGHFRDRASLFAGGHT
jgi:hypothetical protein